jgi:hypothetical protein
MLTGLTMSTSTHPLVLALFDDSSQAIRAARALRAIGVPQPRVSVVAKTHDEEGEIARAAGASPGSELEDSPTAARLGELSAHLLSAIALVMPGIGPIVADGPLAADLGEVAGHAAGGIARILERAGLARADAEDWQARIGKGAILVGAHVAQEGVAEARQVLNHSAPVVIAQLDWPD